MNRMTLAAVFAAFGALGWAQDDAKAEKKQDDKKQEDKIGKKKAPEALKLAGAEMAKKKGYHAGEKITLPQLGGQGGGQEPSFDGIVLKDICAMKGSAEVYAKQAVTLVKNTQGQFVDPEQLQGAEQTIAASFRNPWIFVQEVTSRFAATSGFGNDEAVDGVDCKVAETFADEKTTQEQIKEVSSRIGQLRQYGVRDISGFTDKKASNSSYKVWIGKTDLLIRKIEWTLTIAIDKNKIPGGFGQQMPDKVEAKTELTFSKYDESLDWEWPKEIKAKFGVK
jgi:hypothetical protein